MTVDRRKPWALRLALFLLVLGAGLAQSVGESAQERSVYRCWSFNAGGAGGSCRTAPPLIFNADGTYQESSTHGRYTIKGDRIAMSESRVRGPGRLGGNNIVFEYVDNNVPHTVTYLLQSGRPVGELRGGGGR